MESKQLFFLIFSLTFFSYIQSSSFSLLTWASSLFEEPLKEKRYIPIDQTEQAQSSQNDYVSLKYVEEDDFVIVQQQSGQPVVQNNSGVKWNRSALLKIILYLNGCARKETATISFNSENIYTVTYKQIATGSPYQAVFTNKGVLLSVMDQGAINLGALCLDDDN